MRRSGRHRCGPSGEPRRRSRENVALLTQLLVLTPQPDQFIALGWCDDLDLLCPASASPIGHGDSVADRLRGRFELTRKIIRIAAGAD
jgi:hypothetical protein